MNFEETYDQLGKVLFITRNRNGLIYRWARRGALKEIHILTSYADRRIPQLEIMQGTTSCEVLELKRKNKMLKKLLEREHEN